MILANTGIRHGTEADNLRWKHITLFEEKGDVFLEMSVRGKTGRRDIICRSGTINYLKRIQGWCPDVADMNFAELIKGKIDLPVFRLPDGTASQNLRQTLKRLMIFLFLPKMENGNHANITFQRMFNYILDTHGLKLDQDGQPRTTYSLRHYAVQTRLNKGGVKLNIYDLARNVGTSVNQLERFYLKRMKVSKKQRENLNRSDSTE